MKLTRWNGEHWYNDDRPIWRRVLRWAAWFGGWESHHPRRSIHPWTLRQRLRMLTPVSLLNHRITFYGWGSQVRTRNGFWVHSKRSGIYWSPNGTPSQATIWIKGTPRHVVAAALEHQAKRDERNRENEAARARARSTHSQGDTP